uniref:Uncharacterized protein n=1 Tax=Anguilla anguilla TaxID=7936 RepID=A0A0E9X5X8_ANGAN
MLRQPMTDRLQSPREMYLRGVVYTVLLYACHPFLSLRTFRSQMPKHLILNFFGSVLLLALNLASLLLVEAVQLRNKVVLVMSLDEALSAVVNKPAENVRSALLVFPVVFLPAPCDCQFVALHLHGGFYLQGVSTLMEVVHLHFRFNGKLTYEAVHGGGVLVGVRNVESQEVHTDWVLLPHAVEQDHHRDLVIDCDCHLRVLHDRHFHSAERGIGRCCPGQVVAALSIGQDYVLGRGIHSDSLGLV